MNPSYQINTIVGTGTHEVTDVASALVQDTDEVLSFLGENTTVSIGAELKSLGLGDVASNLRFKGDKDKNNLVVNNYMKLFEECSRSGRPIIVTTVSRKQRHITYHLTEEGIIEARNSQNKGLMEKETMILGKFMDSMSISRDKIIDMRESSKGAGYRTYLADSIAFIYLLNSKLHPEMFITTKKTPFVVNTQTLGFSGDLLLTEIDSGGRKWVPKEGFDYLYFTTCSGAEFANGVVVKKHTNRFLEPKEGSITKVYHQLNELLTLEENGMKEMVRKYFEEIETYNRFSDYWVNDVDDALTIYMIYNAYKHTPLTTAEETVKEQIFAIIRGFS